MQTLKGLSADHLQPLEVENPVSFECRHADMTTNFSKLFERVIPATIKRTIKRFINLATPKINLRKAFQKLFLLVLFDCRDDKKTYSTIVVFIMLRKFFMLLRTFFIMLRIASSRHYGLDPRHTSSTTASEHSRRRVSTRLPARTSRRDTHVSETRCRGITHGGSARHRKFRNNAPFKS